MGGFINTFLSIQIQFANLKCIKDYINLNAKKINKNTGKYKHLFVYVVNFL